MPIANKKKPAGAGTPTGSATPTKEHDPMRTTVAEAPKTYKPKEATRYLTFGQHRGVPTSDEKIWAELSLRNLTSLVSFDATKKAKVWFSTEGEWFHSAGHIIASTDEPYRFRIWLYAGATVADLEFFERVIERAKAGRFLNFGWRKATKLESTFIFDLNRQIEGPEDRSITSWILEECTEPACEESYHDRYSRSESGYYHTAYSSVTDEYQVSVERWPDGDDLDWGVTIDCQTTLQPLQLASFLSDLRWAQAEAAKLNGERVSLGQAA